MYFSEATLKTIFNEVAAAHEAQAMALFRKYNGRAPTARDKDAYRRKTAETALAFINIFDDFIQGDWQDAAIPGSTASKKLSYLRDELDRQIADAVAEEGLGGKEKEALLFARDLFNTTMDRALAHVFNP